MPFSALLQRLLLIGIALIPGLSYSHSELNFSLLVINGNQRTAYLEQVQAFEAENPDIKVNLIAIESETYKANIESWLKQANNSDVMYWFSGERLNWFASQNLIESIDELWAKERWSSVFTESSQSTVKLNGQYYAIPVHYYNWGVYYNREVFDRLGLLPPQNWDQFLAICALLKKDGITPISLGSAETWPTAGWFDYLNLRINGLPFHQELMRGEISYHDPRIKTVFEHLGDLVRKGYFLEDHSSLKWKDSLPYLYRGLSGMMLMGNFWTSQLPESMTSKISIFRFPQITPDQPFYEEAPTNVLFIPKNAKNKLNAQRFIKFMARTDVQIKLNQATNMLTPQNINISNTNHFLEEDRKILSDAAGLSQFYDRDSPLPIALKGMEEIKRFMLNPTQLDAVLTNLERLRLESFQKPN